MNTLVMLSTILVALITAVIGPLLITWFKARLERKPEENPLLESIRLNELVDEQIQILLDEFECDRIWVGQFHNGGYFYPTGKSIQKFSIFYEKCAPDVVSIQSTFQNVPVSLFPKAMTTLYKEGEISIPTYDGEDYDLGTVSKPYKTKSLYIISLDDLHDRFIGVLAVAYNTEYKFTKEDWIFIRQKAGAIGALLDDYLKHKK